MSGRLLVTGASGLVGRAVLRALEREPWQVVPTSRSPSGLPEHRSCDLSDPALARELLAEVRPDVVVHLAGGTAATPGELYRNNVLATVHLLEAAARLGAPPYCLVFGSAAEYGDASEEPIAESAPLRPVTDYGRAKAAQTTLAAWLGRARGMPLTVLRPFNLVTHELPATTALGNLRRQLLAGSGAARTIECGRLDIVRDFIPLATVEEAIRRLLEAPAPERTLNLCSGVGIAVGAILDAMAEQLGVTLRVVERPELAAIPAAPQVVGDPTALRATLGLTVTPTPGSLAELLLH
jgi:GDP-4-dehydro-6-deoxy-D-mannose reductase